MSVYTSRGKLTIDATSDTTKINSVIAYLKNTENSSIDVINGLGFGALNNRLTAVKAALTNPATFVGSMEAKLKLAQDASIADYQDALEQLLKIGVEPKMAKERAMQKVKANASYNLALIEAEFPSSLLEQFLEQSGLKSGTGAAHKRIGMLGGRKLLT